MNDHSTRNAIADLEQALGLYHAIMALHRNPRSRA